MKIILKKTMSIFTKLKFETVLITLVIIFSTLLIVNRLNTVRDTIKESNISKLYVIDNGEVEKLCKTFQTQWNFKHYSLYIYQPNSPIKTHKELVSTDVPQNVPIKLGIDNFSKTKKFTTGEISELSILDINVDSKYYIRIPIYQYNVIVAELFIYVDNIPTKKFTLMNYQSEAQVISNLIM